MKKALLVLSLVFAVTAFADEVSRFFANESVQRARPEAFVLQPESRAFLDALVGDSAEIREALVAGIRARAPLAQAIRNWDKLSIEEQIPHLREVFALEVAAMGIAPPELVIDAKAIPGRAAFFEFDVQKPGPGRVLLNPDELRGMDKFASLALLIHETRHSAQFQKAFAEPASIQGRAFKAAFEKQFDGTVRSFCDFLTLNNEFEAFSFGNWVVGRLTDWQVEMPDMGAFASQYDRQGRLKIDLPRLAEETSGASLLEKFNEAERTQCELLGACKR